MTINSAKVIRNLLTTIILSAFVLAGSIVAFGQQTQSGKWKAKVKTKDTEKIHISFYQDSDYQNSKGKYGNQISGQGFEINELQGLSYEQINGSNSSVNFTIIREAGTIQLTGTFNNGEGTGTWTFASDPNFVSALRNLGFEDVSERKLFASAVLNVKSQTVTELRNAGLKNLDYEDIFKATIFKIDANYIREMSSAGFKDLDMEDLVKGRIFKIDANYAREILALGFGEQTLEELVKFRIFKVTPEFLTQMKAEGLNNLTAEDVVQLRIFKIDGAFIQSARAKGFANPSVGELVELKIHGKVK